LKLQAACFSAALVSACQATWCYDMKAVMTNLNPA